MQLFPYFIVLISAITHGIWNFLARRADDKNVFIGLSKATYVGALRQLSLVIAVFLGWRVLKEPLPAPRLISLFLLVIGSGLIAFAN